MVERIYIQNANGCIRNKDLVNVRTSGDWCKFTPPEFSISGTTKIQSLSIGDEGLYLLENLADINLSFSFSGDPIPYSSSTINTVFEIYKYDFSTSAFTTPNIYTDEFPLSGLTNSGYTVSIPYENILPDNEYLIKTYFEFDACTEFLNILDVRFDSRTISGNMYGLYDENFDYYMSISYSAETPLFTNNGIVNSSPYGRLVAYTIFPTVEKQTEFVLFDYVGEVMVNLNGLTLAPNYDYIIGGINLTISAETTLTDVITIVNVVGDVNTNGFTVHQINVGTITSGATDGQGTNDVYYNTTHNKYEIYTPTNILDNSDVIVSLNGVILANNIDYYKSITNDKRIILEGIIMSSDVIHIYYFASTDYIGNIYSNTPTFSWYINNPPQALNGHFTLQLSTGNTFSNIIYSSMTDYVVGQTLYNDAITISGSVGTEYYYRVKNEKFYQPITGNTIDTIAYSEIVPIIIATNAINSY